MAYEGFPVEYILNMIGGRWFIPSNTDVNETVTELIKCKALSPDGKEVVATASADGEPVRRKCSVTQFPLSEGSRPKPLRPMHNLHRSRWRRK